MIIIINLIKKKLFYFLKLNNIFNKKIFIFLLKFFKFFFNLKNKF